MAVNTWDGMVNEVRQAQGQIRESEKERLWYRGQSDTTWQLIPSLFRLDDWKDRETTLFEDVSRHADRVGLKRDSPWELLCEMQHHRIPTRLLDWTETFGVALFFALRGKGTSAIYILNPARLNAKWKPPRSVKLIDATGLDYKKHYLRSKPPDWPLAAKAFFDNPRMFAQQAVFTVHGSNPAALEEILPLDGDALRKVELTEEMKLQTAEFFAFSNINAATVFPDIAGLAGYLRKGVDLEEAPES